MRTPSNNFNASSANDTIFSSLLSDFVSTSSVAIPLADTTARATYPLIRGSDKRRIRQTAMETFRPKICLRGPVPCRPARWTRCARLADSICRLELFSRMLRQTNNNLRRRPTSNSPVTTYTNKNRLPFSLRTCNPSGSPQSTRQIGSAKGAYTLLSLLCNNRSHQARSTMKLR